MRVSGAWHFCDDGVVRPTILGEVFTENGHWEQARFLLDTGADRTVLSADLLSSFPVRRLADPGRLSGVGGIVRTVVLDTRIRLPREAGGVVTLLGHFAAFLQPEASEVNVLGRDVLNLFAAIVDWTGDTVCLLGQRHGYSIHEREG